jgi:hypothetical protein
MIVVLCRVEEPLVATSFDFRCPQLHLASRPPKLVPTAAWGTRARHCFRSRHGDGQGLARSRCLLRGRTRRYIQSEKSPARFGRRPSIGASCQADLTELPAYSVVGKCRNGREFENIINTERHATRGSPVIDGLCGCHPP